MNNIESDSLTVIVNDINSKSNGVFNVPADEFGDNKPEASTSHSQ